MITEQQIQEASAAAAVANRAWHQNDTDFKVELAHRRFPLQFKAYHNARAALHVGGIDPGVIKSPRCDIRDAGATANWTESVWAGDGPFETIAETVPVLSSVLIIGTSLFHIPLTDQDRAEYETHKIENERLRTVWNELAAEARQLENDHFDEVKTQLKPRTKAELLDLVKGDAEGQEQCYLGNGPDKYGQDGMTGVQCVAMNYELLVVWLDEDEGFTSLFRADRREIWEASHFHYGIMGYEDADADFWWEHEAP